MDIARYILPLNAFVPLDVCPLLHWIVHEKRFPSGSLIGIFQGTHGPYGGRLHQFPVEPFAGDGDPNTGGLFSGFVVKVYHLRVYKPLPMGSVAFTHNLYVVKAVNPDNGTDFVPFEAPEALFDWPLLH